MEDRLVGRAHELAVIDGFVRERGDLPKAMVIEGEPGVGKSALWRVVVETADAAGWRVLGARASETEVRLSYATLTDLLARAWDEVAPALPEPQRRALGAAMLREDSHRGPDPRTIGTAVVTAMQTLAGRQPLLVAVDDAPWVDEASATALDFAIRRLPAGVAVVAAARSGEGAPLPLAIDETPGGRLVRLRPGPLTVAGIHHLVSAAIGRVLPRPSLTEIARLSGGSPLAALELARAWDSRSESVAWGEPGQAPLPLPDRLARLADARIMRLTAEARDVATAAALMARPTVADLLAATGPDAGAAIDDAIRAGVLVADGSRIHFSHPLLAAALADRLPPGRRRQLHGVLARVTGSAEERGHHLAAGVDGPDAEAADAIETAALSTARRGAPAAAANLYRAAIRATPTADPEALARREIGAAGALASAGDAVAARDLAASAAARATGVETAVAAAMLEADLAWADGRLDDAHRRLVDAAAVAAEDQALRGRVHARLAGFTLPLDAERARGYAELAAEALDPRDAPAVVGYVRINQFMAEVLSGRPARPALLDEGLRLERAGGLDAAPSAVPLLWYNAVDDVDAARARHDEEDAWYRVRGDDGWRAERLGHRALTELRAGDWQLAERLADEACEVVEQFGRRGAWWTAFAWRSLVDVHRGRVERAVSTLEPLVATARERANAQWSALILSVLGFARFASGDLKGADAAAVEMETAFLSIGHREAIGDRSETFHVEALVGLGEVDRARAVAERLEDRGRRLPRPWIEVALPRVRALIDAAAGDPSAAVERLSEPLDLPPAVLPFDRAWNDLVLGRILRRARQKQRAADALGRAIARFEALGAPRWAASARDEQERVGLRHVAGDALTESERRVAELAASGLRNREVAAAAFVSEKTVEANLARVYQKLGISSRAELGARLGRREHDPQT